MMNALYFFVLVLNATGLFSFLAPQFGVSIGAVTLSLFALNIAYLAIKLKCAAAILYRGGIGKWLFFLVVWPFLTISYSPSFEFREIGLRLYCFSLFFGAAVYAVEGGLDSMRRLFVFSLGITIIGMALSLLRPGYFEAVAVLCGGKTDQMGRPFGFFMETNKLAHSLIYLFIGWFALWRNRKMFEVVASLLAFLSISLFTGSRTGFVIAACLTALIFLSSSKTRESFRKHLLVGGLLGFCLVVGVLGARYYLSASENAGNRKDLDLADRMQMLLSFKLSNEGDILTDTSLSERLEAQGLYWGLVKEHPVLGYGFGSNTYFYESGLLYKTGHSEALIRALEYGIPYSLAFALMMIHFWFRRGRREAEASFGVNSVLQFVFVVMALYLINGDLFDNRTFYIVWGMLFACVYYPKNVFKTGCVECAVDVNGVVEETPDGAGMGRPLKVLQVIAAMQAGGAEGFGANLSLELTRRNVDVRVFLLAGTRGDRGRILLQRMREAGIEVVGAEERPPTSLRNLWMLVRLIALWRPDVVHAHLYPSEVACVAARFLTFWTGATHARTLHSSDICEHRLPFVVRLLDRFYDLTIACAPSVADAYAAFMRNCERTRLISVRNGALMAESVVGVEERRRARESFGVSEQAFVVAHVGRMLGGSSGTDLSAEPKAHDVLFEAFARSFKNDPDALLLLVGDGPLRPQLEQLAQSLGVGARVRFLGEQSEPWLALAASDLFCFPSRYEGLPLVLLEAASCGLPVVASDLPAIRALYPGDAWILGKVDDASSIAVGLTEMRKNFDEFKERAHATAPIFKEEYSMEVCAERYCKAYLDSVGKKFMQNAAVVGSR